MKHNIKKILYWTVMIAAILGFVFQVIPAIEDFFQNSVFAISYPYSMDYGEGPLLDQTMRLSRFENIYRSTISDPPYTIANYPPLFPLIQVPFAWLFGPAFWYGRAISVFSVLLTALFICLTLHILTKNWIGAVIGGLLLIIFPYVQHWSLFNRIDELALVFSWAGIYLFINGVSSEKEINLADNHLRLIVVDVLRRKYFWIAAVFFLCAIYTRQTYAAAAPFAVFVWCALCSPGSWKYRLIKALLLGLVVGTITLVLFGTINLLTGGGFYLNIVTANINKFNWSTVRHYGQQILNHMLPLIVISVLYLIAIIVYAVIDGLPSKKDRRQNNLIDKHQDKRSPVSSGIFVVSYLLAAVAVSVTIGKEGSNVNYLLELSAAFCLTSGAVVAYTLHFRRWYVHLPVFVIIIGVLSFQANLLTNLTRKDYTAFLKDRARTIENIARLNQIVKDSPGIVLADEYMGLIALSGKTLYLQPFEFKQLADAKIWSEDKLLKEITDHQFDLILWYEPPTWKEAIQSRWTASQQALILISYKVDQKIGDVSIYRPRE
ncbi:MAG TPA: hypothetical protein VIO61_11370 [Anaerolineaceae bacterium]